MRHADSRWDLPAIIRAGFFEEYQARQSREVFRGCSHIVAFVGEEGTRSVLAGVYEICGVSTDVPSWPSDFPFPAMQPGKYHYSLRRVEGFAELENRLVVDWGTGTRSWVQWLRDSPSLHRKPVIELLPRGYARDFPGYGEVVLLFDELATIIAHPDANRGWHTMLRSVAGIYLIADSISGEQYVGSAYGAAGILGRWQEYARTKHGGNTQLRQLLKEHPDRYRSFRYSILRTLPRTMTAKEVIQVEALYKKKLGTRAFGLNSN